MATIREINFKGMFLTLEDLKTGDCCIVTKELDDNNPKVYMKINEKPASSYEIYMINLKDGMLHVFNKGMRCIEVDVKVEVIV